MQISNLLKNVEDSDNNLVKLVYLSFLCILSVAMMYGVGYLAFDIIIQYVDVRILSDQNIYLKRVLVGNVLLSIVALPVLIYKLIF